MLLFLRLFGEYYNVNKHQLVTLGIFPIIQIIYITFRIHVKLVRRVLPKKYKYKDKDKGATAKHKAKHKHLRPAPPRGSSS